MTKQKCTFEEVENRNKQLENEIIKLKNRLQLIEKEEDLKYDTILDTLSEGIALNEAVYNENEEIIDSKIVEVNSAFYKLTGFSKENTIGNYATQLYGMQREQIREFWIKNKSTNQVIYTEMYFPQADKYLFISTSPIKNNRFVTAFFDITERKKNENELKTSKEFLDLIFNISPNIAVITRFRDGCIVKINERFSAVSEYKKEEVIGKTSIELNLYENIENRQKVIKELEISGYSENNEILFRKKSGAIFPGIMSSQVVTINNEQHIYSQILDITDRKKAEELLNKSVEHIKMLIELAPDAFFQGDLNGNFIAINNKAVELTGYTKDELLKMNMRSLFSENVMNQKPLRYDLLNEGKTVKTERELLRKDGTKVYVEMSSKSMPDGSYKSFIRDITDRIIAEQKIRESENKFRKIYEEGPLGMALVGKDYKFSMVNNTFSEMMGYSEEELKSMTFKELTHPDFIENDIQNINKLIKGEISKYKTEKKYIRKDKKEIWGSVTLTSNFVEAENEHYLVVMLEDITERKQFEQELITAKERAEENNKLKTAFLQNISHEIRTPMNAINGFSKLLNQNDLPLEKRRKYLDIIQNSSNQLLSIVSNILTISSLETNQEKINNSKININTLVAELKTIFKQQFSDKNISFVCTATLPDNEVEVSADKTKLIQILTNLISNAIKFTSNGEITFGYQRKGDFLEFFVKDSGIGIPKEKQQLIFERFRQADISISEIYGGTGLGLSISKGFVELMGGEIWVESEPNKGASFYFTIPYNKATEQEIISNKVTFDNANELFGTILIAEDEEFNFLYIEQLLSNKVNKLIRAVNGKEAVELCKAHPDISLVLMDIKLPLMAGDVAAKIIKNFRPNLPILAQSAYALNQEIEQYRNVFDDYLTKPIEEEELISKLKKFLK